MTAGGLTARPLKTATRQTTAFPGASAVSETAAICATGTTEPLMRTPVQDDPVNLHRSDVEREASAGVVAVEVRMFAAKGRAALRFYLGAQALGKLRQDRHARRAAGSHAQRPIEDNEGFDAGGDRREGRFAEPDRPGVEQRGNGGHAGDDADHGESEGGAEAREDENDAAGQQHRRNDPLGCRHSIRR